MDGVFVRCLNVCFLQLDYKTNSFKSIPPFGMNFEVHEQ